MERTPGMPADGIAALHPEPARISMLRAKQGSLKERIIERPQLYIYIHIYIYIYGVWVEVWLRDPPQPSAQISAGFLASRLRVPVKV